MSKASEWLGVAVLNHFFRGITVAPPARFIGLFLSDPTNANVGLEIQGGSYVRQAITFAEPVVVNGVSSIRNSIEIRFPTATSDWGTVTHIGIFTATTGGNLLTHAAITPREFKLGDEAVFSPNSVTISLD